MVNLDGNAFEQTSGEFIQWMVTNIPDGADITKGNEVRLIECIKFVL